LSSEQLASLIFFQYPSLLYFNACSSNVSIYLNMD
jgi:hypothetical protein